MRSQDHQQHRFPQPFRWPVERLPELPVRRRVHDERRDIEMFRKMMSSIVVGAVALALASCSNGGTTTDDATTVAPAGDATVAASGGYIPVITTVLANPYWDAESETAQKALEALGYETAIFAHDNDPQKQSELIDAAISKNAVA